MQSFKFWGIGDTIEKEISLPYDGSINLDTIEAISPEDFNNHITFNRTFNNLYENDRQLIDSLESLYSLNLLEKTGVFFESLMYGFQLEESDFFVNNGKYYLRVKPGIAVVDSKYFINRPTTSIAEREIDKIMGFEPWKRNPEKTEIHYNYEYDRFHAKIHKYNADGMIEEFLFTNGADFLDFETNGYSSGIELIQSMIDNLYEGHKLEEGITDLTSITLEPTFELAEGALEKYIVINSESELYLSDEALGNQRDLFRLNITNTSGNITINEIEDLRTFISLNREKVEDRIQSSKSIYSNASDLSSIPGRANDDFRIPIDGTVYNFNELNDLNTLNASTNAKIDDKSIIKLLQNAVTAEDNSTTTLEFPETESSAMVAWWSLLNKRKNYKVEVTLTDRVGLEYSFTHDTDTDGMTLNLGLDSETDYDFYINWGENPENVEHITSYTQGEYTYSSSGQYLVSFGGYEIGNLAELAD